ncbi:MAG: outer membrane beta-barrel protein [Myxococcales bacterium]|nr:outer membrane beta-barrel protein [Myxococcales bacterium]
MTYILRRLAPFGLFGLILFGSMLALPSQAQAQFKHHGLGIILGTRYTFNVEGDPNSSNAIAQRGYGVSIAYFNLGLEYQYRFLNNWLVGVDAHISFHSCNAGQTATSKGGTGVCERGVSTPIMFTAATEIRYLFLTDEFRPYVGLGIGVWQSLVFVDTPLTSFGPVLTIGFEWFFKEELSLGLRVRNGLQLLVGSQNITPFYTISGGLVFNAYF